MESMSTEAKYPYCNPEVWGGIECTINRVGDIYRDQLLYAGHYERPGDIEQFSAIGLRKLRYPILWEKHQPHPSQDIDWGWTATQLERIRKSGMDPIAGLVHHGSGPAFTSLSDKSFPQKLATYATKVAEKFPWINYYTPVNEPLTTARFSGLYGFWYPHKKDQVSFARMLLNQVKGIVLSMQAIRKINPDAKLVQTEDLSKIHSTTELAYQANFENKRRWLTFDLLCGKVNKDHYFWRYFRSLGITVSELQFFIDNPCPPDIIGFNYYVTSERFLDHNIENYPISTHGGNGRHSYADTEAVRVIQPDGLETLLKSAWKRYKLPMAITECHINCSREEQLRWFKENWDTCCRLRKEGIDVKAITAWSLLGAFDWNSLLMVNNGHYETGVFDIRENKIRPTALSKLIRSLSESGSFEHPLLLEKGWWNKNPIGQMGEQIQKTPPLLIIGRNGTLGQAFIRICERRSIPVVALSRKEMDISKEEEILQAIDTYKPWAIINAAGYVRVDDAESNSNECFAINSTGPGLLAKACQQLGLRLMTFSSDLVFDGSKKTPYHELDKVNPLNVYGASKAEGEELVTKANASALIIRTSAFFGPWDKYNFVYSVLQSIKNGEVIQVPGDVMVSPTYVPDLAETSLDLFIDEEQGIWHITNEGMMTWADFGAAIADRAGLSQVKLKSRPLSEMGWKANRPLYSVLQSEKGVKLPVLEDALVRYFEQRLV